MRYHFLAIVFILSLLFACPVLADDTGAQLLLPEFLDGVEEGQQPHILYTGRTVVSLTMRSEPDASSASLGVIGEKKTVQIFGYDQQWLFCWSDDVGIYYLLRSKNVDGIEAVDPENTPPYGVITHTFVATTANEAVLRYAPNEEAEAIFTYPSDTRMSMWFIQDGWAVIPYRRIVGYMYVGDLKDLTPVAPNVEYAQEGDIIAAFTSFYSTATTELNAGRMENMRVGCVYIDQTYEPGFEFDFNGIAGPYKHNRGYMDAPVLIDGQTVSGSGGGTCQVSTTLYNALLQLWDGITIVYRRPHGPGGAAYAPHGVDAAVGRNGSAGVVELNLKFRNDYDFPITLDSTVQNGALCICIRKGA